MEDGDNNTNNQAGERNQQQHCQIPTDKPNQHISKSTKESPYKQNHVPHAFTKFTEPKSIWIRAANQHSRRGHGLKRLSTKEHGRGPIRSAHNPGRKGRVQFCLVALNTNLIKDAKMAKEPIQPMW
jgi:hypothetical protein